MFYTFKVTIDYQFFFESSIKQEYLKIFIHYGSKSIINNFYNHNISIIILFCTFSNFNICKIFNAFI